MHAYMHPGILIHLHWLEWGKNCALRYVAKIWKSGGFNTALCIRPYLFLFLFRCCFYVHTVVYCKHFEDTYIFLMQNPAFTKYFETNKILQQFILCKKEHKEQINQFLALHMKNLINKQWCQFVWNPDQNRWCFNPPVLDINDDSGKPFSWKWFSVVTRAVSLTLPCLPEATKFETITVPLQTY